MSVGDDNYTIGNGVYSGGTITSDKIIISNGRYDSSIINSPSGGETVLRIMKELNYSVTVNIQNIYTGYFSHELFLKDGLPSLSLEQIKTLITKSMFTINFLTNPTSDQIQLHKMIWEI